MNKMKLNNNRTWEGWVIQVNKGDCLRRNIMIGNIYRPPNDSYTEFIDEFMPILNNLESDNSDVIIARDYNIRFT